MKLSLSANINKLRKEHSMTQEQLAEALGVTFASVSKWERGAATPELNLIAEMADLFGVSFDALVGFEVQNSSVAALEERIHELQSKKKYEEALTEAEKALLRYPNDFRIVYRSGELYAVVGGGWRETRKNTCIVALSCWNIPFCFYRKIPIPKSASYQFKTRLPNAMCRLASMKKGLRF